MNTITFYKMNASGNDFIVIDHRDAFIPDLKHFAEKVCVRQYHVGADGVLLIEKSLRSDFKMRILNADGSEAEMCGNGSRCVALFAHEVLKIPSHMTIETLAGVITADLKDGWVKVKLTDPKDYRPKFSLEVEGRKQTVSYINTGVPHVVLFPEHLGDFPVLAMGRAIRFHKEFAPRGTNVNFVQVTGPHDISVRTYERGVEDETFACGTGVTASSVVSAIEYKVKSPVNVFTSGGEILKVHFDWTNDRVTNVYLEGKAQFAFRGELMME